MRATGQTLKRTVVGEEIATFVPYPLPPRNPVLIVDGELAAPLRRAEQALARLEVAGEMAPSVDWFIYAFVRKEAVISSQIEGTQATLIDLFEYEAEPTSEARNRTPVVTDAAIRETALAGFYESLSGLRARDSPARRRSRRGAWRSASSTITDGC